MNIENKYNSCCIKSKENCGTFTKLRQPVTDLFVVKDLNLRIADHIISLSFDIISPSLLNERNLIGNRYRSLLNSDSKKKMCKASILIGLYWKSLNASQHPNHKKGNKNALLGLLVMN